MPTIILDFSGFDYMNSTGIGFVGDVAHSRPAPAATSMVCGLERALQVAFFDPT